MTKRPKTTRPARARATAPVTAEEAAREAARRFGALGGRSGRGDAKRRPIDYRELARLSAGWRIRPATFYASGEEVFFRTSGGSLWSLGAEAFHLYGAAEVASLPRSARLLPADEVPGPAARLARRLGG
jgi:hypothetical protein